MRRRNVIATAAIASLSLAVPASAKEDLSADKITAKRYISEVWGNQNFDALNEMVSPKFSPANADDAPGVEGLQARLTQTLFFNTTMVTKIAYSVQDIAAESDRVFLRGQITGTSNAGKKIAAGFFVELTFNGGLITREWSLVDQTALLGM